MKICLPVHGQGMSNDFDVIYRKHFAMLFRVCYSYTKNKADSEDIISDVFVKLIKKTPTFADEEHEKRWLLRAAINQCKDYFKHWWRRREDIDDYEHLNNSFKSNDLLEAVLELPAKYKGVIYLHYYEGYSTGEIAEILHKPPSSIRVYMYEARKLLKGVLENE